LTLIGISTPRRPVHLSTEEDPYRTFCGRVLGSEEREVKQHAVEKVSCERCLLIQSYKLTPGEVNPDLEEDTLLTTAKLPIWLTTHYVASADLDVSRGGKIKSYKTRCGRVVPASTRLFDDREATCKKCRGEAGEAIRQGMANAKAERPYQEDRR
jgi:hypothetical protein